MIAYIREQGAKIRREGERLLVCGKNEPRILFSHQLEQIMLFGNVHLTAQARSLLLAKEIDTVFLSANGSYRGRLVTREGENVFLRKQQYDLLNAPERQLEIAREIVIAKLHNQTTILGRFKREHHLPDAVSGITELKSLAREASTAASLESLRGVEGAGAAAYFHHFAQAFHKDWGFVRRARRPPTDPVNVVLSFLYTLLADRAHAACRVAGLDPFPGCLHTLEYGRMALPLDLMEEFRAVFADALTLSLFNSGSLKPDEFKQGNYKADGEANQNDAAAPEIGLIMTETALKKVISAFAKKMATEFHHPVMRKAMTYADAVNFQAMQYRHAVEGKNAKYCPLLWH